MLARALHFFLLLFLALAFSLADESKVADIDEWRRGNPQGRACAARQDRE
jgi:hypothetical protein